VADPKPPTIRQREIARLIATEGLTYKETAERLGVSVYTVRSQVYGTPDRDGLLDRIGGRSALDIVRWHFTTSQDGE
jgi:DNA-binding NarL/FixJ family response regulator